MLRKCYQRRLIPLTFNTLVLENELQYHGLAVRVKVEMIGLHRLKFGEFLHGNSRDDRAYLHTPRM